MDNRNMEIFGIHFNEFEMIKGSLKVKTTIRKIFVSENPTKQKLHKNENQAK